MSIEKNIQSVLRDAPALEGTGLFAKPHFASGCQTPQGKPWRHAVVCYQISVKEAEGLGVKELVALVQKKRKAALEELMAFLRKEAGKAKKVYALEGWFLREFVTWGAKSELEPRAVSLATQEETEPFEGATVYIDSTYAFA